MLCTVNTPHSHLGMVAWGVERCIADPGMLSCIAHIRSVFGNWRNGLISHFLLCLYYFSRVRQIVLNIDLAPTFVDIAKVAHLNKDMDGASIMMLLRKLKKQ